MVDRLSPNRIRYPKSERVPDMATESPQPLERMAPHITYEMAMFVYAASLYPQLMAHEDKGIGSLLFEACLIHFRNLL